MRFRGRCSEVPCIILLAAKWADSHSVSDELGYVKPHEGERAPCSALA
jgi:hypothetical protein